MGSNEVTNYYRIYHTSHGDITLMSDGMSITGLKLGNYKPDNSKEADLDIFDRSFTELQEYFSGKRHSFDIPLRLEGTEYQKKVWQLVSQIPYGQTATYKDISLALGKKKAFRAVGGAVGKNPVLIFVPCHRVIGLDGSLTGYAGGTDAKRFLLDIEQHKAI